MKENCVSCGLPSMRECVGHKTLADHYEDCGNYCHKCCYASSTSAKLRTVDNLLAKTSKLL